MDNNEFGYGIFIDLKKAFEKVNHSILLSKLNHYGVRGKACDWFQSYLSNREQFVCINSHKSDSLSITCGVPQGSIRGPLMFCYILMIYILDPSAYGFGNARGFLSSTCAEELWVEIEWFTEHLETA